MAPTPPRWPELGGPFDRWPLGLGSERAGSPIGIPLAWQHGGTSITLGQDRGLPVTDEYTPPFPWNGALHKVVIEAGHYQPPAMDVVRVALEVD